MAATVTGTLHLTIHGTNRVVPLRDGARLTAGRIPGCDIRLDDQSVSRRHCTIEVRGNEVVITDLESANGTYVNERPIQSATVVPGDLIRIGATALELRDEAASARAPGGRPGLQTEMGEGAGLESVIRKRFEPSQFDWLTATTAGGPALVLLQRAQRHLTTMHHVSEALATARDVDRLSDETLGAILEVTEADRAALVLRRKDPESGEAEVAAARARVAGDARFTVSRTLVADVIEKGVSTVAHDASTDARFSGADSVIRQHVRSVMCVPLRTADEVLGALYVDSLSDAGRFDEAELELLAAIGNQAGTALHRVRLLGELERLLIDTIRAIAATIDAKDGYTHRHSERVALLSLHLARAMGLPPDVQETIHLSALLHDVGKIAVPDSILNKPGRLTAEEFDEMRKHPAHGARILGNIQSPAVQAVLPGVKHHHEKWDGTGYPDGLKGDAIPEIGRVLGVADFFDALTSARAYRAAMSVEEAVALIEQAAGTHFDPQIADLVVRLHHQGALLPEHWDA